MCVCVGAGGGVVSGRQWRVLESVEHIDAALLPDGAVLVLDAAAMSADDSGECWSRWSTRTQLCCPTAEEAVVSVDGSGECWSQWSMWTQLSCPTVKEAAVSVDGSGDCGTRWSK